MTKRQQKIIIEVKNKGEFFNYQLVKSISFHIGLCFNFRNKIRYEKQQNIKNGGKCL